MLKSFIFGFMVVCHTNQERASINIQSNCSFYRCIIRVLEDWRSIFKRAIYRGCGCLILLIRAQDVEGFVVKELFPWWY